MHVVLFNMRVQTLKYSAFRILWRNRLSSLLHIPTHCAGIIRNYSIHTPVYQLFGNISLIYLKGNVQPGNFGLACRFH